ncbi:unnamed protein product [Tilletia controversa]|uniref:Ubiquitin-like domain-containing protein n=1 Tax=Tilletia controversa TaxID=13291 RepID=A0A8X7MY95_9BASI|nr:hypothetical protein CF328_g1494 [Tilletia controversa]KAE8253389.1 hypothetical protein A4X06_0g1488 [Tilletia controversa]CAD6905980.1 unnamed protein product [Tilletia controversa]CAD6975692.1 unnamed protein product [Tilletia controversa]
MQVLRSSVETSPGNTVDITIESLGAADKLTTRIQDENGRSLCEQSLTIDGDNLQDRRTLSNAKVRHLSNDGRCLASGGFNGPVFQASTALPTVHSVTTKSGRTIIVEIQSCPTIDQVTTKIQDSEGVKVFEQCLIVGADRPFKHITLSDDNVRHESTPDESTPDSCLTLNGTSSENISTKAPTMRVVFRDIHNEVVLHVDPSANVWSVRPKLEAEFGIPIWDQRFLWAGDRLTDEEKFSELNFEDGDCIDVMRGC